MSRFLNFGPRTSNDDPQSIGSSETVSTSAPTSHTSVGNGRTMTTPDFPTTLHDFAYQMATAASVALKTPKKPYNKVVTIILYWENPPASLRHLVSQAQKLRDLFKDTFDFDVKELPIPKQDLRPTKLTNAIEDELEKVRNDPNSLFILYYGGHASWTYNKPDKRTWKAENRGGTQSFEWTSAMDQLFTETVVCRKVFIFDCCHSGAMINPDHLWRGRTEILAACAPEIEASALEGSSFTEAIYEMFQKGTRSIYQAHATLCGTEMRDTYGLKKTPYYNGYGDRESHSTIIRKFGTLAEPVAATARNTLELLRERSIKLDGLQSLSDAMILVAVTFKGTAEGFMNQLENFTRDWRGWFDAAPGHVDEIAIKACTLAKFHGVFDSNSCTTIWSIPVWLWDAMAPSDNARYLGVIHSDNRATTLNDMPFLAASNGDTSLKNAPPVSSAPQKSSKDPRIDEESKVTKQPLSLPASETSVEHEVEGEHAEMKPTAIEGELLEREDVVRRKEQELMQREPDVMNKEAKLRELERKLNERVPNIPVPKSGSTVAYNLLSFDGDGVRGIQSMIILQKIMDRVREIENAAAVEKGKPKNLTERKPVDYFDLAAGTSTGGLIALMLFRLEMNCTDGIQSYKDLAKLVFQPKLGAISLHTLGRFGVLLGICWLNIKAIIGRGQYSHKPLEQAIDAVVAKHPYDTDDAVKKGDALLVKESRGRMFMCATLADRGESILLRNYEPAFAPLPISTGASDLDFRSITIKEAARATSAAPTYLKQAHIQGLNFWDGGLLNNNPIDQVWDNRYDLVGNDDRSPRIKCIVSLGTSHPEYKKAFTGNFIAKFFNTVSKTVSFATNTEAKHRDFERNMQQYNRRRLARKKSDPPTFYYRFNASTDTKSLGLADYLSMPALVAYTENYLQTPTVEIWVEECAQHLAKIRRY